MDYFKVNTDIFKKVKNLRDRREKKILKKLEKNQVEFIQCKKCGSTVLKEDLVENEYICPKCNKHLRMPAKDRLNLILDEGYEIIESEEKTFNPLRFSNYEEKINSLRENDGLNEAVVLAKGSIYGNKCYVFVMDSNFLMGSMGLYVGEKISKCFELAKEENLPVVSFSASGGARMQEGIFSLMQMANTTFSLREHSESGNLYVSVMTDPTSGGVTASFASLGDIIIAEPEALICFTGRRVIEQTIKEELPKEFQSAECLLEHGFLDDIVPRKKLKDYLGLVLKYHRRSYETEVSI
ncbi:acetyl-CoA carboxylase carboxyl transferase subunit beta [Anaerosphaera aminiphila DSM 21120]|uniref:Acetyl-coenzyme A carboxylase carboxyl transferase subunit beta n=1 Tax=Anaerosphaera aminiphila DSM 21120 TaxID=1120995 RepID=A0A1M5U1R3_9FIRM|nr:acetyl-CoA carboxylase carboxyltransferase subunit beta [Anaerosphaera aminiphila]SHH56904.1 acetyl-CoA carboxylase carboxyl transferase subunit beta [Anaerosphaera aminiphila DSM 21120]